MSGIWDGIGAEILLESLATSAKDWNISEMSIYDDYDATKAIL